MFLEFVINHMAGSHLSKPMGESSKIVPTLRLNCVYRPCTSIYGESATNVVSAQPQRGQVTGPSSQRMRMTKANARSSSAK